MKFSQAIKLAANRFPRRAFLPYGEQALFPDMRAAIAAKAAAYIASNPRPRASFLAA